MRAHHVCADDDFQLAITIDVGERGRGLHVGLEGCPVSGEVQVLLPLDSARPRVEHHNASGDIVAHIDVLTKLLLLFLGMAEAQLGHSG